MNWREAMRVFCGTNVPLKVKGKLYKTVVRLSIVCVSVGQLIKK